MKYLCLIYQDESLPQKLPKAEFARLHAEYAAFVDEIIHSFLPSKSPKG
jgi:hypothetical protein